MTFVLFSEFPIVTEVHVSSLSWRYQVPCCAFEIFLESKGQGRLQEELLAPNLHHMAFFPKEEYRKK